MTHPKHEQFGCDLVAVSDECGKVYCVDHIPDDLDPTDEHACTPVLSTDDWINEVGPCVVCGKFPVDLVT